MASVSTKDGGSSKSTFSVERVHQAALDHRAAGLTVFRLEALGDLLLERGQIVGPEAGREFVVDLGGLGGLHILDRAGEDGFLAREMLGTVFIGELDGDVLLLAGR